MTTRIASRSVQPVHVAPLLLWCALVPTAGPAAPRTGDVYREYATHSRGDRDWRVTDPQATPERARAYLPNPVLTLEIDDLRGAIRAEAVLDRWGGHLRTTDKRIRFNEQEWIQIPEISTVPGLERAPYYYSQDNPVVPVPLDHLREGTNTFQGTCGVVEGYNWGQWGLYSLILRVYYDPKSRDHPAGRIRHPAQAESLQENPRVTVEARAAQGVARVDVLAWFAGYDEDGDGEFAGWHSAYHQPLRGAPADLSEHVGTAWREPYEVIWNTRWVPDQAPGAIKIVARIQDSRGLWSVTPVVEGLSLERPNSSVRLYRASDVPERFGVRAGQSMKCAIPLPADARLDRATQAVLALRTWHGWDGHHSPLRLNGQPLPIRGKNHHYDFDLLPVPVAMLRDGANRLGIHSDTEHHMLEVLWPGPALLVRYGQPAP
jgi:hypothetical protein